MRSSELDVLTERGLVHNWDKGYSALLTEAPISHLAWAGAVEAVAYRRQRHQPQLYLEDEVFLTPDEAARLSSRNFAGQYLDRQGFNWRRCLVRGNCGRLAPEQLWTRFHGWVTQHVGPDAFRRSIAFLDEHLATSLPPRGLEAAEDLRLLALSHGARQNLSCFADRARWHLSDAVRAELAARFGDEGPLCRDADRDGFAAADGDCDDGRAGVGPGAEELANGRDDNCNGVVDERVVAEDLDYPDLASGPGGTLPALWTGRIQDRRDVDTFVVEAGASRRLAVQFCGDRKLLGRLDVGGRTLIQVTSGRTGRCQLMRVDGSGRVEIDLTPTDRTKGSYELLVWPSPPNPRRFASTMRVEERPNGRVRFLIPRLDLAAQEIEPKSVRFWVSGQGFVGKRKARPRVDFAWRPPADLEPGEYTVWAQLFRGRHPVSPASEPVLFRYGGR